MSGKFRNENSLFTFTVHISGLINGRFWETAHPPFPKPKILPKERSVDVRLGEGQVGSFPETTIDLIGKCLVLPLAAFGTHVGTNSSRAHHFSERGYRRDGTCSRNWSWWGVIVSASSVAVCIIKLYVTRDTIRYRLRHPLSVAERRPANRVLRYSTCIVRSVMLVFLVTNTSFKFLIWNDPDSLQVFPTFLQSN